MRRGFLRDDGLGEVHGRVGLDAYLFRHAGRTATPPLRWRNAQLPMQLGGALLAGDCVSAGSLLSPRPIGGKRGFPPNGGLFPPGVRAAKSW